MSALGATSTEVLVVDKDHAVELKGTKQEVAQSLIGMIAEALAQ